MPDITAILKKLGDGDRSAMDELMPLVYDRLKVIARRHMRRERRDHTLSPTALVHEAFLKLVDQDHVSWQNRIQFYAVAATAMRRILVSHARRHLAQKRGGGQPVASLGSSVAAHSATAEEIVALGDALKKLEKLSPRQTAVVEMSFFGGLKQAEIAGLLGVSVPTVRRDWRIARAWLTREMRAA